MHSSSSSKIPDSFNLYPRRLLGSWAISVINQKPALWLPVLGVPQRLVCHIHGGSLLVVISVLTVHMGTPQRPGDKDVCYYNATAAGVLKHYSPNNKGQAVQSVNPTILLTRVF